MKFVYVHNNGLHHYWREALLVVFDSGAPGLFNIEWLLDKAEHSEWGG